MDRQETFDRMKDISVRQGRISTELLQASLDDRDDVIDQLIQERADLRAEYDELAKRFYGLVNAETNRRTSNEA